MKDWKWDYFQEWLHPSSSRLFFKSLILGFKFCCPLAGRKHLILHYWGLVIPPCSGGRKCQRGNCPIHWMIFWIWILPLFHEVFKGYCEGYRACNAQFFFGTLLSWIRRCDWERKAHVLFYFTWDKLTSKPNPNHNPNLTLTLTLTQHYFLKIKTKNNAVTQSQHFCFPCKDKWWLTFSGEPPHPGWGALPRISSVCIWKNVRRKVRVLQDNLTAPDVLCQSTNPI